MSFYSQSPNALHSTHLLLFLLTPRKKVDYYYFLRKTKQAPSTQHRCKNAKKFSTPHKVFAPNKKASTYLEYKTFYLLTQINTNNERQIRKISY